MQITFRFLSTKSGKSFILQVEHRKYAFNVFEGFQRYCIEKQLSIASIDAVFLTNRYNVPALIGIYLTLGEVERADLNVISTFNVEFHTIHKFSTTSSFKINFMRSFQDKYVKVEAFDAGGTTNYIVDICEIKGRLHPERVPSCIPKYLYKTLINDGHLEIDGVVYRSSDYSDKNIKVNTFCLIFSSECLDQVVSRCENARSFFCFNRNALDFICESFPHLKLAIESIDGIFYVCDNDMVEYEGFFETQLGLSKLDRKYRLPYGSGKSKEEIIQEIMSSARKPQSFEVLHSNDSISFNKSVGFRLEHAACSTTLEHTNTYQKPCLEFLGTGCAIPSKYRNVSSILYQNDDSAILLDCGEDTLSQVKRLYGDLSVLKKLKLIYISHAHADHMLGLASVVQECREPVLIIGPLFIKDFLEYFGEVVHLPGSGDTRSGRKVNFIPTANTKILESEFYREQGRSPVMNLDKYVHEFSTGQFKIKLCGCKHSKGSTSIAIHDTERDISFSYSGDTTPSVLFAWISRRVDVMVHEATFNDDQKNHALKTNHSTKKEALDVFEASQAKKLLLTHFSNRNNQYEPGDICVSDFYRHVFE